MTNLLLVEDNESLGAVLSERLIREQYSVRWAKTCAEARAFAREEPVDLAILDIGLPDGDGFQLARELGGASGLPILFLTAMGSAEARLQGFELGAIDYIPKPFHLKELLLRISRAVKQLPGTARKVTGECHFEPESFTATFVGEIACALQPREYRLLELLITGSPRVFSRQEIIDRVWERAEGGNARSVDNLVARLRQVIPERLSDRLRSVRGVGYQWGA